MSQLTDALDRWAESNGVWITDNGQTYSSNLFGRDLASVEHLLAEFQVHRGDHVFVALPNSYAFVVVYVALLRYGAVVVPGNPAMPQAELVRFLSRFEAKMYFVVAASSDDWQDVIKQSFAKSTTLSFDRETTIQAAAFASSSSCLAGVQGSMVDGSVIDGSVTVHRLTATPTEDDPAVLMFTSGTTGSPKGVLLRHRHLMQGVSNVKASHQLTQQDIAYCMLPLFHINAQVIVLLATLCSGGCLVMRDKFHASSFWNDMKTYGITWVSCVPTILSILAKGETPLPNDTNLRFIRSASAPLSPAILSRFEAAAGIPVVESYGMTEAAGQICMNPLPPGKRKPGSVGLPVGVELHVVVNGTRRANAYEIGEIVIRGGNVIEHYALQEGSQAAVDNGFPGFIFTGDLGYTDEDGYVYITGRSKEMINRAGEKLSPREIEDVLNAHEAVQKAAVIGVPDTLYGERVVAYVVAETDGVSSSALTEQLRELCLNSLVKHKRPSEIRIVETLPVGPTGKIQKHLLKDVANRARLA